MGLATDLAIGLDPSMMMVKAGFAPDEWQKKVLRDDAPRLLLNCTRQAGKSTVIACKALKKALYHAPSLVLIVSPSERQSKELLQVVAKVRSSLGVAADPDSDTTTSMRFANQSRIVALPGKEQNLRGLSSVALLIIDEASRVPDDLYRSVRPMVAVSGGEIACLSTPYGKRGFFHKEWTEGQGWVRFRVTGPECPRITAAFLAEEKATLPDSWFQQEYMCEFADTDQSVFRYDDVQAAMSDEVRPLFAVPNVEDDAVTPLFQ